MYEMFTLKIYEKQEGIFKNPEDAINFMIDTDFKRDVSVYDINSDKAYKKTEAIYEAIKRYNKGRSLDNQILPTWPFGYRGILGCLGVQVYEIGLGTYKQNHESIALFTGFKESVLDTSMEKANIGPGLKALSSLAMLGGFM